MTILELDRPKSICIVMLSGIGDAVHVLPVANALRRAWPDVRISWIIQPVPRTLVEGHPAIDELLVYHRRRRGARTWTDFAELGQLLKERNFDLALALQVRYHHGPDFCPNQAGFRYGPGP